MARHSHHDDNCRNAQGRFADKVIRRLLVGAPGDWKRSVSPMITTASSPARPNNRIADVRVHAFLDRHAQRGWIAPAKLSLVTRSRPVMPTTR